MRWNTSAPIAGSQATTDGVTPVTLASFNVANGQDHNGLVVGPPLNDCMVHVQALLLGVQGANRVRLYVERSFGINNNALSALDPAVLTPLPNFASVALAAAVPTLEASTTFIRARATGVAATTIVWSGYLWLFTSEIGG